MNLRYHYSREGFELRLKPLGAYPFSFPTHPPVRPGDELRSASVEGHPRHSEDLQPLGLALTSKLT